MDKLLEEDEIKIEYNESFEMDPLCDESIHSSKSNMEQVSCILDESNQFQTDKERVVTDETSFNFNHNNNSNSYNSDSDNLPRREGSWYDSIDNSGRLICKFCDLKYSTLQTLRFHVNNKHPEHSSHIKENIIKYKRNRKLKCHICNQRFKELLALKSHVDNNHSLEDFKTSCLYCDAMFSSEYEMSEHLFIQHKKVIRNSTYMCRICGYRTSTKSHYNQHKNIHVEDKTKKCQYCDYATNYLPNLTIHERIHTKEKVYVCDFMNCEYSCSTKSALRSHQLKHNPENNVLYCDKCSYKTIYRQCLKRHSDCHKRNSLKLKLN